MTDNSINPLLDNVPSSVIPNQPLQNSYTIPALTEESSSSYIWVWLFILILIGLFVVAGYYYILYYYNTYSFSEAIEKAIKQFNKTSNELREDKWNKEHKDRITEDEKDALGKAIDDALNDTGLSTKDGFTSREENESIPSSQLGQLNWCFIDEKDGIRNCKELETNTSYCLSGDIFPTRDICINPKLRSM
jgi:hypothetical protein